MRKKRKLEIILNQKDFKNSTFVRYNCEYRKTVMNSYGSENLGI
jgi:hypothetical protein